MKKFGKILLIVWAVLATLLLVLSCIAYSETDSEKVALQAGYNALKADFDELEEESRDILLRELTYKMMCDSLFYKEFDLDAEIEQYAEQYTLSDFEKVQLAAYVKVQSEIYLVLSK